MKHMNKQKTRISMQLVKGNSMLYPLALLLSPGQPFRADIGPACIKAPIKTSRQYSYIRYV